MPDDGTSAREGPLPTDHPQRHHLHLRFRFLEPFGMASRRIGRIHRSRCTPRGIDLLRAIDC